MQSESNDQKVEDIRQAISNYISDNCNCQVFSPQYIVDAKLVCLGDNEVIFTGKILSTGELNSTSIRDNIVQEFLHSAETVNIDGQPLRVDNYCLAVVLEAENYDCVPYGEPTDPPTATRVLGLDFKIGIGAGAGLFLLLIVSVCCLTLCCCCNRNRNAKEADHGLNVQ